MLIPRDYQYEAVNSIYSYFETGSGNPLVAMPTGTGKSLVIAEFIRSVYEQWPFQRVMMLTHVKELIEQNAQKLQQLWPTAPLGIFSAGLKQKDIIMPIIFAGVASVAKSPEIFGHRDLIIIDEAHLLSPNESTMYQQVIKKLKDINPFLKVIGLTATPYRIKQGMLIEDGSIFTDICIDLTSVGAFNRFIAEGYLAPLVPQPTKTDIDFSGVGVSAGDFKINDLDAVVDTDKVTYEAVKEMIEKGYDRKCWLIFANSVKNSEHIASMLQSFGVSAAAVHSKKSDAENDEILKAFKSGELRAIVNNNKLTTGFDHPPIDMIGMLRATLSPGLWVQMLGRGTRPSPDTGKENCLVLDFAKNTPRLGPINDPRKPQKPGAKKTGDVPAKLCPSCNTYNHISATNCTYCGVEFKFKTKLFQHAGSHALIKEDFPQVEYLNVTTVLYKLHEKTGSRPSIKVTYFCGMKTFQEWVCLEHEGFAGKKARDWWRMRHTGEAPETTELALLHVRELRVPKRIRVHLNKLPKPEILNYEW